MHDTEKRIPYNYWIHLGSEYVNAINVHRGAARPMKLKVWLGGQLIRIQQDINYLDEKYGFEISPGHYISGKEADERLAKEDAFYRSIGLPGLDE